MGRTPPRCVAGSKSDELDDEPPIIPPTLLPLDDDEVELARLDGIESDLSRMN